MTTSANNNVRTMSSRLPSALRNRLMGVRLRRRRRLDMASGVDGAVGVISSILVASVPFIADRTSLVAGCWLLVAGNPIRDNCTVMPPMR